MYVADGLLLQVHGLGVGSGAVHADGQHVGVTLLHRQLQMPGKQRQPYEHLLEWSIMRSGNHRCG